jgi:hypothetical protein
MSKINPQKSFLPQCDGRALDFIKTAAALCMVIDHVNMIWLHSSVIVMEFIGRATFPLFCYAVAVAAMKARAQNKSLKPYIFKLLVLAVLSQPFFFFAHGKPVMNVIFSLALGAALAAVSFRIRAGWMYLLYTAALLSMLWVLPLEFGLAGVMLPSAVILVWRGEKAAWPFLVLLLLFVNAGGILHAVEKDMALALWMVPALSGLCATVLPWLALDTARHLKQTDRFLPKYALHIFYPGHLLLMKLLGRAFFP